MGSVNIKRISVIAAVLVCLSLAIGMLLPAAAAGSALRSALRGDADGDGAVTISDVTAIQRRLSGLSTPTLDERAADVDGNGMDITDVTWIQRYLAGLGNIYHINEPIDDPDPTMLLPTSPYEAPYIPGS